MNHYDDESHDQPDTQSETEPESLVRRVLQEDNAPEVRIPDQDVPLPTSGDAPASALLSPIPGYNIPAGPDDEDEPDAPVSSAPPLSPIRPSVQDDVEPREPLTPSPPGAGAPRELTPREQMQRVEEALIRLREKMANVAARYAQGQLNQAQFEAIYARYSEQRDITERLLARDPESQAWQSVIRPGHTGFLMEHFAAHVVSYAIYDQQTAELINVTGPVQVKTNHAHAVIERLKKVITVRGNPGPAQKQLSNGRCVVFVPGDLTVAVVIFSVAPSAVQLTRVQDLHKDFERANQHALRNRDYASDRLVFPHRALLEDKS